MLASLCAGPLYANLCATPGKDGTGSVSGVVNTYYPGTADVPAGATSISIGSPRGAAQTIAAGDLLLVIQMQDTSIDTDNNDGYGNNNNDSVAWGYTAIQQAGRYEYVRATGPASGGSVPIVSETGGLIYSYVDADYTSGQRKQSFQVIRVPQYNDATISGTVTGAAWNGETGGVVAIDVADQLTFSGGSISVSGIGFRGGGGRDLDGAAGGSNTDYRNLASLNFHAAKGEGIAGTPRFVYNSGLLLDTAVEGYLNGSSGRGAPANAGGGGTDGNPTGNDQNSGGGGGANWGAGGQGGHAWCPAPTGPNSCPQSGGHPGRGSSGDYSLARVIMGGGGGAGTNNNGTGVPGAGLASSGAAGGGIVFVRAGEIAGAGSISADGASANTSVANDGGGGGGGGGSVVVSAIRSAGGSISISANGGNGGTNTGTGVPHGPGGGGGGGYIASTTGTISTSTSVSGGTAGTTQGTNNFGANYGATAGSSGSVAVITAADIRGVSSGCECTPTVTKSFTVNPIPAGGSSVVQVTVRNNNPDNSLTGLAFTDTYPTGLINTTTPNPIRSCGSGTLTAPASGSTLTLAAGTIAANSTCTYSANVTATSVGSKTNTLLAGSVVGNYGAYSVTSLADASASVSMTGVGPPLTIVKSSQVYTDPINATNPKAIPGAYIAYTLVVANPGAYTVDSNTVVVLDATPANLELYVGDVPGVTGPVQFQNGVPSSTLTYTFTSLASPTDDVDFSNNGGSSWAYVPTPNAFMVDPNVTHIRIRPKGTMAANSSFSLLFGYRIK